MLLLYWSLCLFSDCELAIHIFDWMIRKFDCVGKRILYVYIWLFVCLTVS